MYGLCLQTHNASFHSSSIKFLLYDSFSTVIYVYFFAYSIALPKVYAHIRNHKMKNINILFQNEIRNEETEILMATLRFFTRDFIMRI